jgi:mRNA-degrading endonuclease RelE of RelBE toxin-antitoxin system
MGRSLAALQSSLIAGTSFNHTQGRDAWRIRVGDYRVIYEIHDRVLQVIVITIGHPREVYR